MTLKGKLTGILEIAAFKYTFETVLLERHDCFYVDNITQLSQNEHYKKKIQRLKQMLTFNKLKNV